MRIGEKPTAEESEAAGKILAILQGTEYWGKHQQGAIVLAHLENLCQAYGAPKLLELMHWYASNHTDRYTPNLTSLESLAAGIPKLLAARDRTADEQAAEAQDLPACKLW
ncbi:MAG: hypothetical protein GY851_35460 [bacterium]|nr:hypothetical protein [bacterium]